MEPQQKSITKLRSQLKTQTIQPANHVLELINLNYPREGKESWRWKEGTEVYSINLEKIAAWHVAEDKIFKW